MKAPPTSLRRYEVNGVQREAGFPLGELVEQVDD
jgi:hypothetical protein